jgi:hypothetical protein
MKNFNKKELLRKESKSLRCCPLVLAKAVLLQVSVEEKIERQGSLLRHLTASEKSIGGRRRRNMTHLGQRRALNIFESFHFPCQLFALLECDGPTSFND